MNFVFIEECEVRSGSCGEETWGMIDVGLLLALRPSRSQYMVALGLEALAKRRWRILSCLQEMELY